MPISSHSAPKHESERQYNSEQSQPGCRVALLGNRDGNFADAFEQNPKREETNGRESDRKNIVQVGRPFADAAASVEESHRNQGAAESEKRSDIFSFHHVIAQTQTEPRKKFCRQEKPGGPGNGKKNDLSSILAYFRCSPKMKRSCYERETSDTANSVYQIRSNVHLEPLYPLTSVVFAHASHFCK